MKAPYLTVVFGFYVFATILAIGASITLTPTQLFPGVFLMWVCFGVFIAGAYSGVRLRIPAVRLWRWRTVSPLAVAPRIGMLALIVAVLSAFNILFYTGKSIPQVIAGLFSGQSLYLEYLAHFEEAEIAVFSWRKVPHILAGAAIKLALLFMVVKVVALQERARPSERIFLGVAVCSYLLYSVARGTSFELFEIGLLFLFAILLRRQFYPSNVPRKLRSYIVLAVGAVLALGLFNYNVTVRADIVCMSGSLCVDPNAALYRLAPGLGMLSFWLSGYFVFGLWFTSNLITEVVLGSAEAFFYSLSPLFRSYIGAEGVRETVCDVFIDCGAGWDPDVATLLFRFGLFGTLILVFFLGCAVSAANARARRERSAIPAMLLFLFVLFMVSIPVGNFLFISSSNTLAFIAVLGAYLTTGMRKADVETVGSVRGYTRTTPIPAYAGELPGGGKASGPDNQV